MRMRVLLAILHLSPAVQDDADGLALIGAERHPSNLQVYICVGLGVGLGGPCDDLRGGGCRVVRTVREGSSRTTVSTPTSTASESRRRRCTGVWGKGRCVRYISNDRKVGSLFVNRCTVRVWFIRDMYVYIQGGSERRTGVERGVAGEARGFQSLVVHGAVPVRDERLMGVRGRGDVCACSEWAVAVGNTARPVHTYHKSHTQQSPVEGQLTPPAHTQTADTHIYPRNQSPVEGQLDRDAGPLVLPPVLDTGAEVRA